MSDEDDEGDEGEEEEEEEEEEQEAPRAAQPAPKKASARDVKPLASAVRPEKHGSHGAAPAKVAAAKPAPAAAKKPPPPADDSDDDDDESASDDSEDDVPPPKVAPGKRPAEHQLMSPAAKKTPMAMPSHGKMPATTPLGSKTPITPAAEKGVSTPGSVTEFEAQIVSFLKTHGRTGMSALGGKVKKPGNVPKLNAFIKDRPHMFTLIGDQVELAKKK